MVFVKIENLSHCERETDAILFWGRDDWITSDEFDRLSREWEYDLGNGPLCAGGFRDDDYLLPSMAGNMSPNGDWIFLVQVLVQKGYVERRARKGVVYYRTART